MPEAVKFPSARQRVYEVDPQTNQPVFTRPWFLFLQSVWQRQGGAVAPSTTDVEGSLFEDAGSSETLAMLFAAQRDLSQSPVVQQLVEQQATLQAQLDEQRDLIAELTKTINDLKQIPTL